MMTKNRAGFHFYVEKSIDDDVLFILERLSFLSCMQCPRIRDMGGENAIETVIP